MTTTHRNRLLLAAALSVVAGTALAAEPSKAAKAASSASATAMKAEGAVQRAGKATSEGIQTGVAAANRGADKVGAKVGLPATASAPAKK